MSEDVLARYESYRKDPWKFLCECIYTFDEVDTNTPIKPYPKDLDYLRFLVLMWQKHKKIANPKSRRMTVSWTYIALTLWDCIFHKGRYWAITSKKEENAKDLVWRAEFMYKHIPPHRIPPELLPKIKNGKMQTSPPVLEFPEIYSKIQGFPQGGDQMRQYGFAGILEDECAFQEESKETYVAAEPTIKGGGHMIKVSSRSVKDGGFFKRICFDQLNAPDVRFPEVPPVPAQSPIEGVQVWKNPSNEFLVIDLHYTANPAKRDPSFKEGLMRTLPVKEYRQEYERSWETYDGKPVYEDFNERIHATNVRPKTLVGLPLILGWDSSGLTPACVIAQMQGERLIVLREVIGIGMGAIRFVPLVKETIKMEFPQITDLTKQTISFFDPAGFKRNEITEETYLQALQKQGFEDIRPGPQTWNKRVEAVTEKLVGLIKGETKILIYEQGCPILVAGLKGGFRYPDDISDKEPEKAKPIKDIHSHPNDALQYLCGGLTEYMNTNYNYEIPTPSYSFQKEDERPTLRRRHV